MSAEVTTVKRRLSIGRLFTYFAEDRPDDVAVVDDSDCDVVTWVELDRWSNRLARELAAAGAGQDDIVVVALPNSVRFFVAAVAIWKLGATVLPLSTRLTSRERQRILDLARPAVVVGVTAPVEALGRPIPTVAADVQALGRSEELLPERVPKYWKALTSGGSTGLPKLIVSHEPPWHDPASASVTYMHADGIQLVCGPLYHNAAFIYAARGLFSGNRLVVMSRFDAERALDLVEQHRVTWMQLVPTMMNRLHRLPAERRDAADLSSLRTLLHVGGPCPPPLKRAFLDWLGPDRVTEVYAGTENQGITLITGREWLEHPGSVGRAIRGSRFRVLDERGNDVAPGEVGEIFLMPAGGPGSTYHYVGAEPRSHDGWESLGDFGYTDEGGFLYLVDRSTDCIVTGGANVYPAEVEGAVEALPGVRACAVVGLPDDDLGQRVVALVELEPGADCTVDELHRALAPTLSQAKQPRAYELVPGPLRDEAGKVRRSALRAQRLRGGSAEGRLTLPTPATWREARSGSSPVDRLLSVLDLERTGPDEFVGSSLPLPSFRVFGGQVMAQAAVAAARTLARPEALVHSLHGYFVRQGDPNRTIRYSVTRLRDGRSFQLRRVDAWQDDDLIGTATASFHLAETGGLVHELDEPATPGPEELDPRFPFATETGSPLAGPIELREVQTDDPNAPVDVWMRVSGALPDEPLLHQALLIYMSDFTIVKSAFRRHQLAQRRTRAASLDHSIWLHRRARADRWLHYRSHSPTGDANRALGRGELWADGHLAASAGQEMVIRLPHPEDNTPEPCLTPTERDSLA